MSWYKDIEVEDHQNKLYPAYCPSNPCPKEINNLYIKQNQDTIEQDKHGIMQ